MIRNAQITRPYTHDFRKSSWGNALHTSTWQSFPARTEKKGWFTKLHAIPPRASFMCHASVTPERGDFVLFAGASGIDRKVRVVEVEPCGNPRDMFTLTVDMVEVAPVQPDTEPADAEGHIRTSTGGPQ